MKSAQRIMIAMTLMAVCSTGIFAGAQEAGPQPTGKLMVVWTSGDPDVADKVCLMYTHAAKAYGWFNEVTLVVWGPSQRLLIGDPSIQTKIKAMQDDGIVVQACSACAKKLELVGPLEDLGIDVKGMGVPLTEALKDPETQVLTF